MVTERDVLTGLLNCGYEEVNMLLKSNIDFHKTADLIAGNGERLTFNVIYNEAFWNKVYECFGDKEEADKDVSVDDFYIYTNYEETDIYIQNGKCDFYHDNYPDEISAIEDYIGMEFEDAN